MEFEKFLQNLLIQNKSKEDLNFALVEFIEDHFFEPGVLKNYYIFLLNTQNYKQLCLHFITKLNIFDTKLWPFFLEALSHCPIHLSNEVKFALNEAFKDGNQYSNASRSLMFHNHMGDLADHYKRLKKTKQQAYFFKKQELIDKLEFLKNEKLIDEEQKTLQQLELEYPNEKQFIEKYNEEFQSRWSEHVLSQKKIAYKTKLKIREDSPEAIKFINLLEKEVEQQVVKKAENAIHFCMMFYFMDLYELALKVLQKSGLGAEHSWLELELMILSKHYLSALDLAEKIEKKFYNSPNTEVPFAIAYFKAIAYKGLEQNARAIEMLESILKFRPQYRQAERLINEWLTNYDSLY